jgi:hypothetical protein
MSETILDDIPSPKKAEEIILNRMNAIGYAQQNAYNNYQQNQYNQQPYPQQQKYQQNPYNQNYQQQYDNNQQQYYNNQQQYNQQSTYPQQANYNPQSNYNPQPNYQPVNEQYQQDDFVDDECIQPDHSQENVSDYNEGYLEEVIAQERPVDNWEENNQYQSPQELDKEQIFKKHNQMFKRHNK